MKKRVIVLALACLFGGIRIAVASSGIEVPQAVKDAFLAKFPAAEHVEWEVESDGEYEAEFKWQKKEMSANFRSDGTWLETEVEIKERDLPAYVKATLASEFAGYKVEEACQVETADIAVAYEVDLKRNSDKTRLEALIDADGNVVKKESMESKDDDEK